MDSHPSISIIIPTLQEEKLISRTLGQFTPELKRRFNIEVIVSDGGSTDETVSLSQSRAEVVVESQSLVKQNIAIGRNLGSKCAKGQFLVFINADTLFENPEELFETIIKKIPWRKSIAATCNVRVYPEEEKDVDRIIHSIFNAYFCFLNAIGMGMGRGECHIIPKAVFERSGGYNESIAAGEDYELFLRLRRIGKIVFLRNLTVYESPRRYRKYGYFRITVLWFLNALGVLVVKRAIVNEWKPVR